MTSGQVLSILIIGGLLTGCSAQVRQPVQHQIKIISSYASRWCADEGSETVDACEYSNNLSKLGGLVGALGGGNPAPIFQLDPNKAYATCKEKLSDAIYSTEINQMLSKGVSILHQNEVKQSEWARLSTSRMDQGYHLIECFYTTALIQGDKNAMESLWRK